MSEYSPGEQDRRTDDVVSEAKEAVEHVKQRVKETTGEAVSEVRNQARSALRQQQESAADKIESLSEAIRSTADRLRDEEVVTIAGMIDQAADRLESFAEYLREQDIKDMFDTAQDWARRNPALFLGGAFAAGLLVARLLKSTRVGEAYEDDSDIEGTGHELAYRPRDVGQSRFSQQYGGSAFTPGSSTSSEPAESREPTGGWEEP